MAIIYILLVILTGTLILGIASFTFRGKLFTEKFSNKMMFWRVAIQGLIIIMLLTLYLLNK